MFGNPLILYLLLVNILAFILFRIDKFLAVRGNNRVSENMLFFFALIGGSIGAWLGMYVGKHHKTNKFSFKWGIPLILIIQIVIFYWYLFS